jgi:hypothetical protein
MSSTETEPRSKRVEMAEAAEVKIARASADLAMERLRPRMAVVVASAVLRDQLERLNDEEAKLRQKMRLVTVFDRLR